MALNKRFKCPFCANENVVESQMDHKNSVGKLSCRLCGASYQMPIHHLHEAIDVFSEWLDDCEAAERNGGAVVPGAAAAADNFEEYDEEDGDELDGPSGLGKRKKAGSSGNDDSKASSEKQSFTSLGLEDSDDDSE